MVMLPYQLLKLQPVLEGESIVGVIASAFFVIKHDKPSALIIKCVCCVSVI